MSKNTTRQLECAPSPPQGDGGNQYNKCIRCELEGRGMKAGLVAVKIILK